MRAARRQQRALGTLLPGRPDFQPRLIHQQFAFVPVQGNQIIVSRAAAEDSLPFLVQLLLREFLGARHGDKIVPGLLHTLADPVEQHRVRRSVPRGGPACQANNDNQTTKRSDHNSVRFHEICSRRRLRHNARRGID